MAVVESTPNHFLLEESHPLSVELYTHVLGEAPSSPRHACRLFDIASITKNPVLFKRVVQFLSQRYSEMGAARPTHILGVESRGHLIGAPLALELGIPFVPARLTKRFPSSFVRESQSFNSLPPSRSISNDSFSSDSRVVIVDDFIATGDTIISVLRLADIVGAKVVEAVAICDMPSLKGIAAVRKADGGMFKSIPILTLMHFNANKEVLRDQLQLFGPRVIKSHL